MPTSVSIGDAASQAAIKIRICFSAMRAGVDTVVTLLALAMVLRSRGHQVDTEWCECQPYDSSESWHNQKEFFFLCNAEDLQTFVDLLTPMLQSTLICSLKDLSLFAGFQQSDNGPRAILVSDFDDLKKIAAASFDIWGRCGHWKHSDHVEFVEKATAFQGWLEGWLKTRLQHVHMLPA